MLTRVFRCALAGVVLASAAVPGPARGAAASLGTARGLRAVEVSLDDGRRWLPLEGRSMPLVAGALLRAASGAASLDLADGTRVEVLPFTTLRVDASGEGARVVLLEGRAAFRLPETTRTVIETPDARIEPVRTATVVGEAYSARAQAGGTTGVRVVQGQARVVDLAGRLPVQVAQAGVPPGAVFVPAAPPGAAAVFPQSGPAVSTGAGRAVFGPDGRNVGYLDEVGRLVVRPGFARDMLGSIPAEHVRAALRAIGEAERPSATPLFDVTGAYVGYVIGPTFYAGPSPGTPAAASGAAAAAPAAPPGAGPGFVETLPGGLRSGWPWYYYAGAAVLAGGAAVGIAAAAGGGGDGDAPASPVSP